MTRALLVAALLVGTSSVAAADVPFKLGGYAGLGLGPAAHISNFKEDFTTVAPNGRSASVFGGIRFKGAPILSRFAVEVSLTADSFVLNKSINYDARIIALAAKYSQPLAAGMDVFGKLGVAHTTYNADPPYDVDGSQLMLAVGAEYHIPISVQLSVLVDYTIYTGEMDGSYYDPFDANERFWRLGFTIGF